MTNKDKQEFKDYLKACTDAQVRGTYVKEQDARRYAYETLAYKELVLRGLA